MLFVSEHKLSAMNDVLLSPIRLSEFENLIEKSLRRVLATTDLRTLEAEPYGDFKWLIAICPGIPTSTLRIKSASGEIPGVVKIGKRVLYEKAIVLEWLRGQTRARLGTDEVEPVADLQIGQRKKKKGGQM